MFKVEIIGNIGQDARVVENGGNKFVSFSVAHSKKWKDNQGVDHEETEWFGCTLNGDGGGLLQYLKAGCYSRYFLTSYFCIPVPYNEKDIFFEC